MRGGIRFDEIPDELRILSLHIFLEARVILGDNIQRGNACKCIQRRPHYLHCIPDTQRGTTQNSIPPIISECKPCSKGVKVHTIKTGFRPTHVFNRRITKGRQIGTTQQLRSCTEIPRGTRCIINQQNHERSSKERKPHAQTSNHTKLVRQFEKLLEFTHYIGIQTPILKPITQ